MRKSDKKKYRSIAPKDDSKDAISDSINQVIKLSHAGVKFFKGNDKVPFDLFLVEKFESRRNDIDLWHVDWLLALSKLNITTVKRIKYLFLFSVRANQEEKITELTIRYIGSNTISKTDEILGTGELFQNLCEQAFNAEKKRNDKLKKPESMFDVLEIIGMKNYDSLYKYFYLPHQEEFKPPNFPKEEKAKKQKAKKQKAS